MREELARFNRQYDTTEVHNSEKGTYGRVQLTGCSPLFKSLDKIGATTLSAAPLNMEQVGQDFGYILYSSVIHGPIEELPLIIENVHDRAHIFLDGKLSGIIERSGRKDEIRIGLGKGESVRIDILVENCGRVNYGVKLFDKKGIVGGVRLGQRYHFGWEITSLTMDDLAALDFSSPVTQDAIPAFLTGELEISGKPKDTFLRLFGFHKGFVTVNGFNLGRYWNDRGPQKTLYVPAPVLREGKNRITVFETEGFATPYIEFIDEPELG